MLHVKQSKATWKDIMDESQEWHKSFIRTIYELSVDILRTQLRKSDLSAKIYVGHER